MAAVPSAEYGGAEYGGTEYGGTEYSLPIEQGRTFWFSEDETRIEFGRYLTFKSFGPGDLAHWLDMRQAQLPNAGMIERVPSANNFDPLLVGRYNQWLTWLNGLPQADALRLAGVMDARTILSPRDLPLPVVWRGPDVTMYRNEAAQGRAWIVPEARVVTNALAAMADPAFDPQQVVLIDAAPGNGAPLQGVSPLPVSRSARAAVPCAAASVFLQDSPNAVTIRAGSVSGGWLVLADTFYPGWQAALDGRPVEVLRANYTFRAVLLPPGEHEIVFHYAPLSFSIGAALSLLAWIAVSGVLLILWQRRRLS